MSFKENFRWLLTRKGIAPKAIAEAINVKVNTISNYIHGVSTPNYELLGKIVKFLDVSADDILYNDLPTFGLEQENAPISAPNTASNENFLISNTKKNATIGQPAIDKIPLVPLKMAAAYIIGCFDSKYIETLPAYQLPGFEHGTFRMFEVNGHSMMPTLKNRDKIIGKRCELVDVKDSGVYIIVTRSEGITVKRVLNRIEKDGVLILKSDGNTYAYPDLMIDPGDIIESWAGVAKISRDLSASNDLYTRLDDAEVRLAKIENFLRHK